MNIIQESISRINPKVLLVALILPLAFVIAITLTEIKWAYVALLFAPFIIYLSLKKPFIFPVGLYVFSIPFENLLVMTGGEHGATLTRLLGIMAILALVLKGCFEKKMRMPDKINLWWVLFALYCLLSMTWGIASNLPLVRAQTIIGLVGLYVVVSSYRAEKKEYELMKWFILAGGVLSSIFTLYAYHTGMVQFGEASRVSLMSLEDHGIAGVNKQAFDMLLPLSVCLGLLLRKGKPLVKVFSLLALFLIFFGIVITGSRGGLAAALVILLFFFLSSKNKLKLGFIAALILIAALSITPKFYFDRIAHSSESHADGRTDIWQVGLKAMGKYWLFGAGLDSFPKAYTEFVNYTPVFMGLDRAPHNIFVGMFVELGIAGGALMTISLFVHYVAIGRKKRKPGIDQIILKAAFWALMIGSLSQDVVWYKSFWLLWIMVIMQKYVSETEQYHAIAAGSDRGHR